MSVERNSDPLEDAPTAQSAGYGAAAYVVGYVIFYVLEASRAFQDFQEGFEMGAGTTFEQIGIDPPSTFEVVGWLFYLAHNAGMKVTVSAMGQTRSLRMNPGLGGEKTYLLLIPPAILVATGYLVASREGSPGDSLPAIGASITVGYLMLSVVGVFAFRWSATVSGGFGQEATLTMGPELLPGAFVIGVVYPVIFGGVGGDIAQVQSTDRGAGSHGTGGHRGGHPPDGRQRVDQRPPQGRKGGQRGQQGQRPPATQHGGGQTKDERRGGDHPRHDRGDRSRDDRTGD